MSAVRDCLFGIFVATLPEGAPCRGDRDILLLLLVVVVVVAVVVLAVVVVVVVMVVVVGVVKTGSHFKVLSAKRVT